MLMIKKKKLHRDIAYWKNKMVGLRGAAKPDKTQGIKPMSYLEVNYNEVPNGPLVIIVKAAS